MMPMSDMATELQRRPISVDEYHRMLAAGILEEGERIELLRGDLVCKATAGNRHRACVNRIVRLLGRLEDQCVVQVRAPVALLDDSEPEPDIALLALNEASLSGSRDVLPADVFALIEVGDRSRERDVRFKAALYAEAGIAEYWVVDLIDTVVRVHRNPDSASKRFRAVGIARPGDRLAFVCFPTDMLPVSDILGEQ